jgi:alpha-L-arabinofuranosidase
MISYVHFEDYKAMLDIAGKDIDFLADRGVEQDEMENKIGYLREYNRKNNTNIKYCNTEWLPLNGLDYFNMGGDAGEHPKSFLFSKWEYALSAMASLMMWQRFGDDVDFINFSNFANTHSQSVIETAKEGCYITASGRAMKVFADTAAAYVLEIENYKAYRTDEIQVQAAYNEDRTNLIIYVYNSSQENVDVELDLSDFDVIDEYIGQMLYADDIYSMNTLKNPDEIKNVPLKGKIKNKLFKLSQRKLSFGEYTIGLK